MGPVICASEGCAASDRYAGPAHCAVAAPSDWKTDQRAGAREGRTRPLVVPAADTGELPQARGRWRRLRRSAPSPQWGHRRPGTWPVALARWGLALPAPPSLCSASVLTSSSCCQQVGHSRLWDATARDPECPCGSGKPVIDGDGEPGNRAGRGSSSPVPRRGQTWVRRRPAP